MFEQVGSIGGVATAQGLFSTKVARSDDESCLAATLRNTRSAARAAVHPREAEVDASLASREIECPTPTGVAAEMTRAIESHMPGRIHELKVSVEQGQFILRGISCSYYVKQVAGHLAMTAMDARLLGRLLNEIEVRSVR